VKKGNKKEWSSRREFIYQPVLKVAMTDKETVTWLYQSYGGTFEVRKARGNCKESYCWALRKTQVREFIKYIYPYLKTKRRHAEIILRFPKNDPGHLITDEVYQLREKLHLDLKKLTSRLAP
jgi:hypothetical protein